MTETPNAKHASRNASRRDGIKRISRPFALPTTARITRLGFDDADSTRDLTIPFNWEAQFFKRLRVNEGQSGRATVFGRPGFSGALQSMTVIAAPAPTVT